MRQLMTSVVLVATSLMAASIPPLQPRIILPGEGVTSSFWLWAPKILVVRITSVQEVGPDIVITPPQKLVVHLVAVDADVESVVAGEQAKGPIRFYFFTNTLIPNVGYTTPLSWFETGGRYLAFLREDGGVHRTMADLTEPNIRVRGGQRVGYTAPVDHRVQADLGMVLATIALTPATGYGPDFASSIEDTFNRLLLLTTPAKIAPLLQRLTTHPDKDVRQNACLAISVHFSYTDPCLEKLSASSTGVISQQASRYASFKRAGKTALLRDLREDPLSLSSSGRVEDLASGLELFTFDVDVAIRTQACESLRRLFPAREFTRCEPRR